jgi:hypothetical protein
MPHTHSAHLPFPSKGKYTSCPNKQRQRSLHLNFSKPAGDESPALRATVNEVSNPSISHQSDTLKEDVAKRRITNRNGFERRPWRRSSAMPSCRDRLDVERVALVQLFAAGSD